MDPLVIVYLVLMFFLLILSSCFSGIDMAYATVNVKKLEKSAAAGKKSAALALRFAKNYESTIVTVLFGNSLVNILASSLGAALSLREPFSANASLSAALIEVSMLLIILIFGEILPKVFAKAHSFSVAVFFARFVRFFQILLFPMVKLATLIAKTITKPVINERDEGNAAPTDEELQQMVDAIEEEGIIDEDQSELLHNSIDFKDTVAYEIMTPRVKIEAIEYGSDLRKFVASKLAKVHSRIPVYKKDLDHIVGYIPVKTLQKAVLNGEKLSFEELMLDILEVPFTMEISSILELMKSNHHHIVLVKDEYGGTDGILTLEDILEELVGEMWDESEEIKEDVVPTKKKNVFLVRGTMDIEEFFERFRLSEDESESDYETLSGWINDQLGRFAKAGDHFEYEKVSVRVKKASPYTVEEAVITYHPRRKKVKS